MANGGIGSEPGALDQQRGHGLFSVIGGPLGVVGVAGCGRDGGGQPGRVGVQVSVPGDAGSLHGQRLAGDEPGGRLVSTPNSLAFSR